MTMIELSAQQRQRLHVIRQMPPPIPISQRHLADITSVSKGGYISFDRAVWAIRNVFVYREVEWKSFRPLRSGDVVTEFECFNLRSGEVIYLEWVRDDEVEIYRTIRELKFRDLRDDEGGEVDQGDLPSIAEEEDSLLFMGVEFEYDDEDSWAATFRRTPEGSELQVRFYEFGGRDGTFLTIEEWVGDYGSPDYQIWQSRAVSSHEIAVLVKGG
jgi:hypothetical protein